VVSGMPPPLLAPNADGGIDSSSRIVQLAGAFWLRGTRPTTRSATGRSGALALACSREARSLGASV